MKWFTARNMADLKREYKELAKKYHPDCGGTDQEMASINAEYDVLSARLPNVAASGEEYQPQQRENAKAWRDCIMAIIHCIGLEIEICGSWVWVTGNTMAHRETLKANGYKWSQKKVAWYWHDEGYQKLSHKVYGLNEIRALWGSEKVETERQSVLA